MIDVNDIHSELNPAKVAEVRELDSLAALQTTIEELAAHGRSCSIAGGRHAMGGQQFLAGGTLLETRGLSGVLGFDRQHGLLEVEAGIQWPALVAWLEAEQEGQPEQWAIAQKQTGADRFTIGGSVSANGHGRGLAMQPLVGDVEALRIVGPSGDVEVCSRSENADLFALVVGGYGLFGVIYSVTLRLVRRRVLERVVELVDAEGLDQRFRDRVTGGFLYGDFQFSTDASSDRFLRRGVFSCYRPLGEARPIPSGQRVLSRDDWQSLLVLAHIDKAEAFRRYSEHYLATDGQLYWSDLHQMGDYVDGYHHALDARLSPGSKASEMITEIYVPLERLDNLLGAAAEELRRLGADVIYGTVRLIKRDDVTRLAWARSDFACVIFNLHVEHSESGIAAARTAFRRLIDLAIERDGSYFLTYHRWASTEQLLTCYPALPDVISAKRARDPANVFSSDWYRDCLDRTG